MLAVAMIGGGYFGQYHINAWLRLEGAALKGVVVRNAARRIELKALYPEIIFFADLESLMATSGPLDIIDVATPPASHNEIITPLLGSVPLVICQKPFCNHLEEAKTLTKAAAASTTTLVVHENFRFMPWYRVFKTQLDEGALGDVRQAQFRLRPGDGNGQDAYLARQPYFREMERFLIHETGVHWIDVFRFLFGEPNKLYADLWRTNPVIAGEDSGLILFHWANGLRAVFDGNRTLDHVAENHRLTMGEFMVEGEKATLSLSGDGVITRRERGSNEATRIDYTMSDTDFGGDCVYYFQKHVIDHLVHGNSIETGAADYLRNLEIENAVYASAASSSAQNIKAQSDG